ncbi:hypothetical protein [Mycobacterium sp. NPDC004974]
MANGLEVDAGGLRVAAAGSDGIASGLTGGSFDTPRSTQPSGAGVAAMNAALSSVRQRQSNRITGQAANMSVSGARYDTSDGEAAGAITTVSV